MVLLHGWSLNLRVWDGLVRLLAPHFRVITIDLPGHGHSDGGPEGSVSIESNGRDLAVDVGAGTGLAWFGDAGYGRESFRLFAGQTNLVQASGDLVNWRTVEIYAPSLGEVILNDPVAADARFYRVRLP